MRTTAGGVFDEWFACVENAGPGTVSRLSCRLDTGACTRTYASLPAGEDVVLTVRVPAGDPGVVSFSWRRSLWPFPVRVDHVHLESIPRFKRPHHRTDFIEDADMIARIAEWSVNEPDTDGPIQLTRQSLRAARSRSGAGRLAPARMGESKTSP